MVKDNSDTQIGSYFERPDTSALLLQILDSVSEIKRQQKQNSVIIKNMVEKVEEISRTQVFLRTSINGLRANQPNLDQSSLGMSNMTSQALASLTTSVAALSDKIDVIQSVDKHYMQRQASGCISATPRRADNQCTVSVQVHDNKTEQKQTESDCVINKERQNVLNRQDIITIHNTPVSEQNACTFAPLGDQNPLNSTPYPNVHSQTIENRNGRKSYSEALTSTATSSKDNGTKRPIEGQSRTRQNRPTDTDHPGARDAPDNEGFIAVRRKRMITFHVSNIDPDVTENDVMTHCISKGATPKQIRMFYHGERPASAKIVLPEDCRSTAETDDFWPIDVHVRKWKRKRDWDNDIRRQREDHVRYKKYDTTLESQSSRYNTRSYEHSRRDQYRDDHEQYDHSDRQSSLFETPSERECLKQNGNNPWAQSSSNDWEDGDEWYNCSNK